MTSDGRQRIEQLYREARALTGEEQSAFLSEACIGHPELKREVESLLAQGLEPPTETLAAAVPLAPGSQIGQYKIVEHLGAGGMGTVFRADDTVLGRQVALKVLRPEMIGDAAAAVRFQREARMLASLNHPNIASIYGFEEQRSVKLLALEYVPGPTLAELLRRGPLPIRQVILIGKQIAEALEAAHAKNIVHRDLKPANIKVNDAGQVKVLDFGLAKTVERQREVSAETSTVTLGVELTQPMTILGTPAYMSPEQARGEELDARTDIWSFGCVLYEAVTAKAAFRGKTFTEILAAVLERDLDWTVLPGETPASLRALLKRCLRKDRNNRLHHIADARLELEDLPAQPAQETAAQSRVTRRTAIAAFSGAAVGAAATGVFAISRYRDAVPRNLTQFAIELPEGRLHNPSFNKRVAISPDGAAVVINAIGSDGSTIPYIRFLKDLEWRQIKDVPYAAGPFFSPDSRWFGYQADTFGGLRRQPLSGGASAVVCRTVNFYGGTWADGDVIYFVPEFPSGLMSVPGAGGEPREVLKIDFENGQRQHKFPCAIPGSDTLLLTTATADTATFDEAHIMALSPKSQRTKVLIEGGTHPRFSPSGHLLYARDAKVFAVRFDPRSLDVSGQPFPVLEGVLMSRNTGAANFDVSATGDLVYTAGICDGGARALIWVDRDGKAETLPIAAKSYLHPRLSPDERQLAIEVEGPSHDLYLYDFSRGVLSNITNNGVSHWPVWSPDGKHLSYRSGPMSKFQIWQIPADRSQPPVLVPAKGDSQSAESWSPDGSAIAYTSRSLGGPPKVMVAYVGGRQEAKEFAGGKAPVGSSKFSPDGRWIAYCSNESGKPQVFVQAFPGPGTKLQISSDGGTDPVWKRNGGELYYRKGDSMMVVEVSTAPAFKAGPPRELWRGHYSHGMSSSCGAPGATSSNYDVAADGRHFLMIKDDDLDRATSRQMVVVLGWSNEVRRLGSKV
jgi:serine/threonine protein kinase